MECEGEDCVDDLDGDRFYAVWGVIFSTPGAELSLDAEVNVASDSFTRVLGPPHWRTPSPPHVERLPLYEIVRLDHREQSRRIGNT
jgi:hypothetical protein